MKGLKARPQNGVVARIRSTRPPCRYTPCQPRGRVPNMEKQPSQDARGPHVFAYLTDDTQVAPRDGTRHHRALRPCSACLRFPLTDRFSSQTREACILVR